MENLRKQLKVNFEDEKEDDRKDRSMRSSHDGEQSLDFILEDEINEWKTDMMPECEVTRKDQHTQIMALLIKDLTIGEKSYAISKSWMTDWSNYIMFKMSPSPGAIDNKHLADPTSPDVLMKSKLDEIIMISQDQ